MDPPLVTVLMPMRDAVDFVREALDSILHQTAVALEVVVVDDGSTDGSRQLVEGIQDPRVRLVDGPGEGIAAAFNRGLDAARGAIVMRCDADDRFVPGRIAAQVALLRRRHELGAVCGAFRTIDRRGQLAAELCQQLDEGEITGRLREGETPTHYGTFAVRTEVLRRVGGCRPFFVTAEDIDLQLRLAEVTRIGFVPRPVYEYRLHGASITHNQADERRTFYEETARACRRERAAGDTDRVERGAATPPPSHGDSARPTAERLQGHLISQAWRYHAEGRRLAALRFGVRAIAARPARFDVWRSTLALVLKPRP